MLPCLVPEKRDLGGREVRRKSFSKHLGKDKDTACLFIREDTLAKHRLPGKGKSSTDSPELVRLAPYPHWPKVVCKVDTIFSPLNTCICIHL